MEGGILTVLHDPLPHRSLLPIPKWASGIEPRVFNIAHMKSMYIATGIDLAVYDMMFLVKLL
jgi:hypothetical protein